jgi:hypothetical protein
VGVPPDEELVLAPEELLVLLLTPELLVLLEVLPTPELLVLLEVLPTPELLVLLVELPELLLVLVEPELLVLPDDEPLVEEPLVELPDELVVATGAVWSLPPPQPTTMKPAHTANVRLRAEATPRLNG